MNPVIEKVASAMASRHGWMWQGLPEWSRRDYRGLAEAAIEALGLTAEVESVPVRADG